MPDCHFELGLWQFNLAVDDIPEVVAETKAAMNNQLPSKDNPMCVEISLKTSEVNAVIYSYLSEVYSQPCFQGLYLCLHDTFTVHRKTTSSTASKDKIVCGLLLSYGMEIQSAPDWVTLPPRPSLPRERPWERG